MTDYALRQRCELLTRNARSMYNSLPLPWIDGILKYNGYDKHTPFVRQLLTSGQIDPNQINNRHIRYY